jgi:hypothetical protein
LNLRYDRTATAILDPEGRIIAALVGQPEEAWEEVNEGLSDAIREARAQCDFSKKDKKHRRGNFPAMAVGVSFGGGQPVRPPSAEYPVRPMAKPLQEPMNLRHTRKNQAALENLIANPSMKRVAGFASSEFLAMYEVGSPKTLIP